MYGFVDLNGNPVKRTPVSHPYNYDPYVIWKDESFDDKKCNGVDSDRLFQWDSNKYNKCCNVVFGNTGQAWQNRKPQDIQKFLSLYFEKEIKLTAIKQNCNVASGFPYWTFLFEDLENN